MRSLVYSVYATYTPKGLNMKVVLDFERQLLIDLVKVKTFTKVTDLLEESNEISNNYGTTDLETGLNTRRIDCPEIQVNNDYVTALRNIIRLYFGNVPEATIGALITDVQDLNRKRDQK